MPGIGAIILILVAFKAIAKSSDNEAILFILVPASGLYSYRVITGPGFISVIWPLIPKFANFSSIGIQIGGIGSLAPKRTKDLSKLVSPRSLRVMKTQIYSSQTEDIEVSVARAVEEMRLSFDSDDFKEGVAHYMEKRDPKFTGK